MREFQGKSRDNKKDNIFRYVDRLVNQKFDIIPLMKDNRIKVVEIRDYISNLGKLLNEEKINYQSSIEYMSY